MFIAEFNNYVEIIDVLSEDEYVKQSIEGLGEIDKQKALIEFGKLFKVREDLNVNGWHLSFEWHDVLEGERLLNIAIQNILINIQNIIKNDLIVMAMVIENRNKLKMEDLRKELSVAKKINTKLTKKQLKFLEEQSAIAKALNIKSNGLDLNTLPQAAPNGLSLSVNSAPIPYYLRGYTSIDKEIMLIKSRSQEESLAMFDEYSEIMENILLVEADISVAQMKLASKVIENDPPNNWVSLDLRLNDKKSNKNPVLYLALAIVLGGMIGTVYVLISNELLKRKKKVEK